jgi:hypothetical protein
MRRNMASSTPAKEMFRRSDNLNAEKTLWVA